VANSTSTAAEQSPRERPEWLAKLLGYPQRTKSFLHEVRVEMRQVTWPAKSEVMSTTLVVILTTAFFAVFLWLVDLGATQLVGKILKTLRR
jgi:preprotein translocase subunit SecE